MAHPHFGGTFFSRLFAEISRRLGDEVVDPVSTTLKGSGFSDVIIGSENTERIEAGRGNDVILISNDSQGVVYDGGLGADTYVVSTGVPPVSDIEDCYIFDIGGDSFGSTRDRIILSDFASDSTVFDRGNGMVEVLDNTDGDFISFNVERPDGAPVDFATIQNALIFAESPDTVEIRRPGTSPVIIAEDVEGESVEGTSASDTIIFDGSVRSVNGGRGNDTLYADFRDAPVNTGIEIGGGDGSNTIVVHYDTTDIEDCFIFDIGGDGIATRKDTVKLVDFGIDTEILDLGDGNVQLFEPSSGLLQVLRLEDTNGEAVDTFTDFADRDPSGLTSSGTAYIGIDPENPSYVSIEVYL